MSESETASEIKTPWHFWLVGIFALLWSAMGAMDYFMTQTKNESYLSSFSMEQLEYFYSFPSWVVALWACAVWGSVLAAILLLLRKKIAAHVFLFSLVCMIATTIHNYGFANGLEVVGDAFSLAFTAVIFMFIVAFYLYSTMMTKRGLLK